LNVEETSLSDPIEAKIAWAEERYRERGTALRSDEEIAHLLDRLRAAADDSHRAMVACGIVELCTACERDEGGSCCGAGLEDRYDGVTLLINRLLGAALPAQRRDRASCHFLGESGCLLRARDVICINFLCKKIETDIPAERIAPMRALEGEQLETLFALHSRITATLTRVADG
jgi:hypothetical protein